MKSNQITRRPSKVAILFTVLACGFVLTTWTHAETPKPGQVLVEKKASKPKPLLYKTTNGNIFVAPKCSPEAAQAQIEAANGNVYAAAINNGGVSRGVTVVRRGDRLFLVAESSRVAKAKPAAPATVDAPKLAAATPAK